MNLHFDWSVLACRSSAGLVVVAIHLAALILLTRGVKLEEGVTYVGGSAILLPAKEVVQQRFSAIDVLLRKPELDVKSPEVEWQAPLGAPVEIQPMVTIGPRLIGNDASSIPTDVYPQLSLESQEEGDVDISVQVLADGSIGDVLIEKSSGHERLDRAAEKYIRQYCKFSPGLRDGEPYVAWKVVRLVFHAGSARIS